MIILKKRCNSQNRCKKLSHKCKKAINFKCIKIMKAMQALSQLAAVKSSIKLKNTSRIQRSMTSTPNKILTRNQYKRDLNQLMRLAQRSKSHFQEFPSKWLNKSKILLPSDLSICLLLVNKERLSKIIIRFQILTKTKLIIKCINLLL